MLIATLLNDIQKNATSIEITHTDAILNFTATGGWGYIGTDYFSYTGIASYTLTGVSGLRYPHLAGEEVSPTFGLKIQDLIPKLELNSNIDEDGFTEALYQILDDGYFADLKRQSLGITRLIDPVIVPATWLPHYCSSLGVEVDENATEGANRMLALNAIQLLKARGSLAAFKFVTWYVLGYDVDVDVFHSKIPSRMNDRHYHMLIQPYIMEQDARSTGLWNLTEGSGVSCVNQVDDGPIMTLEDAAMWVAGSMFAKDISLELSLAHPYAIVDGSPASKCNIHGKEEFSVELFVEPATSIIFPQIIVFKNPNFVVYRPNATDLTVEMSNGLDTDSQTIQDVLTADENQLLSILYARPVLTVCVNGQIIYEGTFFDYTVRDAGGNWEFGDFSGVAPFIGKIDTPHLSVGLKRATEVYTYWEHIDILRSHEQDPDKNSYMFVVNHRDGYVEITVNNDDGDEEKHKVLEYLIAEWLGVGGYSVIYTGHLPLERKFRLFRL